MAVMPVVIKDRPARRAVGAGAQVQTTREASLAVEPSFLFALSQERKRSERSGKPFLLLLMSASFQGKKGDDLAARVVQSLQTSTREIDTAGWYEYGGAIGVLYTELPDNSAEAVQAILTRLTTSLSQYLAPQELDAISITCHLYPEEKGKAEASTNVKVFYPDVPQRRHTRRGSAMLKRSLDVAGSLTAILVLSPVFLVIAVLVKLTSRGPVLFRQDRVGQYGNHFTFLKFRSMYVNSDSKIHQEYVTKLIAGKDVPKHAAASGGVFKITNDPRITPLGRLLRRTSLDELPQFFNVLRGDMSLVGPRPPVPYEFKCYDVWHRTRVFEVKPGITGLWQVMGRSRTSFDDMVRLDLAYAKTWSIWLDIKILLQTPRAVLSGDGAF